MSISEKKPVYKVIFDDLFEKITNGTYKIGEQIPTEKELMSLYNTSRITVAKAVSELKDRNYIHRQKGSGSFVSAKNLWDSELRNTAKRGKPVVAVVISSVKSQISVEMEVLQGILKFGKRLGYRVAIFNNDGTNSKDFEKGLIDELLEEDITGVMIFPCLERNSPELYNMMTRMQIPYVVIDREIFGVDAPLVTSDNRKGFYSIVEYVISRGHKRIAYVSGNTHISSCRKERFYGYVKALTDNHLDIDDELIKHNIFKENYYPQYYNQFGSEIDEKSRECSNSIRKLLEEFMAMENPPTAIVVTNDYIAASLISIFVSMGYSIPDDISICGYDGLISNILLSPVLTTVFQDFRAMGKAAVTLLDEIIKNPHKESETIKIPTRLFIGDTVKKL